MKKLMKLAPVLAAAAFLAGCQGPCDKIDTISGPELTSGSADFSTYVATGTSISAGYQSGGLVNRHQVHTFPAVFAQQIGKIVLANGAGDFTFDAINNDGIGSFPPTFTLLELKSLSPLVINNVGRASGAPVNLSQNTDYHNLGVPGALAADFVDSTLYTVDPNPVRGTNYNKTFFNLIWRSRGLPVQQTLRLAPTFISYEFGANEVLGAATSGTANVFPPANYAAALTGAMNTIHAALPNAKLAMFNVPNVTSIPFCTTLSPITVVLATGAPVGLVGPGGLELSATDLVLLPAADSIAIGTGIPVGSYNYLNPTAPGNGRPLLDSQVLSGAEQTTISNTITAMNAAIDTVSQRPWIAKVDMNGLLADIATNGYRLGGTTYTSDFVTGGIFSLDGVHPTDLAHAILCNAMIDAVNARFGATIPNVNPTKFASGSSSSARPAPPVEGLPGPMQLRGFREGLRMLFPGQP